MNRSLSSRLSAAISLLRQNSGLIVLILICFLPWWSCGSSRGQ